MTKTFIANAIKPTPDKDKLIGAWNSKRRMDHKDARRAQEEMFGNRLSILNQIDLRLKLLMYLALVGLGIMLQ